MLLADIEHYLPSVVIADWLHSIGCDRASAGNKGGVKGQESTHLYPWDHERSYYAKPRTTVEKPGIPPHSQTSYIEICRQRGLLSHTDTNLGSQTVPRVSPRWMLPPDPEQCLKAANEMLERSGRPPLPKGQQLPVVSQFQLVQKPEFQWVRYTSTLQFIKAVSPYSFECYRTRQIMCYEGADIGRLQHRPSHVQAMFDSAAMLLGPSAMTAPAGPQPSAPRLGAAGPIIEEFTETGIGSPGVSAAHSSATRALPTTPVIPVTAVTTTDAAHEASDPVAALRALRDQHAAQMAQMAEMQARLRAAEAAKAKAETAAAKSAALADSLTEAHAAKSASQAASKSPMAAAATASTELMDDIMSPGPTPKPRSKRGHVIDSPAVESPAGGTRSKAAKPTSEDTAGAVVRHAGRPTGNKAWTQPPAGTHCHWKELGWLQSDHCAGVSTGGKGPKKWIHTKKVCEACNSKRRNAEKSKKVADDAASSQHTQQSDGKSAQ